MATGGVGSSTFYSTVATILPLFVLTLTATNRFGVRSDSDAPGADAAIGIGLVCAAAIGEFSALDALATGGTHTLLVASELGIGFAGLFLFGDLVWAQVRAHGEHKRPRWERTLVVAAGSVAVGLGALLLAFAAAANYF